MSLPRLLQHYSVQCCAEMSVVQLVKGLHWVGKKGEEGLLRVRKEEEEEDFIRSEPAYMTNPSSAETLERD